MSLVLNAIRLAIGAIFRNTMRSILTVIGIAIGVWAVVTVVAVADGATGKVGNELDSFAANAIYVHPMNTASSGARSKVSGRLTENDGRAIAREAVSVSGVGYWLSGNGQIVFADKNAATEIIGTNLPYFPIRKWEMEKGDFWTEQDELFKTKVCLIGTVVRDKLFGAGADPVGQTVRVAGFPYKIVGVLKSRGASTFGNDQDDRLMMPIGSFRARIQHTSPGRVDQFIMGATSADTVDHAVKQTAEILRQRHHIEEGRPDDFEIQTQAQQRAIQSKIFGGLSILLLGVAGISLVVGGIGVMNIMLVSVTERTREIGIRMSIGAREGDILTQFLVEAIVLSFGGGIVGMIIGVASTALFAHLMNLPLQAGIRPMLIAMATSATIGLVFGFFPARRAAKLDPIECLRVE